MEITFVPHPDRRDVLTVFYDGTPWREVHSTIFGKKPALPQNYSSFEEFVDGFAAFEYQQAKNYALRRLSLQAMLSSALAKTLKERLVSQNTIGQVIAELIELGIINDEDWTASFVRGQASKKVGPRAIAQKLAVKGIRGEKLEQALEKSWTDEEQQKLILNLLKTRYARRDLSDFKEKQKVVASLVRRGFELSIILNLLECKF